MGSSKRHKEKSKDKDSRKRHRSRSRERGSHKDKDRRERKDASRHSRDYSEYEPPEKIRIKDEPAGQSHGQSSGDISLSIEETNRLRAKLGLKPLAAKTEPSNDASTSSGGNREDIHRPAQNIGDLAYVQKLREKIAAQKEKRKHMEKIKHVKTLGDGEDSDDESTAAWVKKNRILANEKQRAEKMAQLLDNMDQEFGIGSLVEEEFNKDKQQAYSAKDIRGLRVEHAIDRFQEDRSVVLTLKDKGVLDEDDEDVLVNVNIQDYERATKNKELRKKKPAYNPYDDAEYEEEGNQRNLLSKYDEEIDGEKRDSFRLGEFSAVYRKKQQEDLNKQIQEKRKETLVLPPLMLASEFYTEEEMVKFKKPKKKLRRKKTRLRADDLLEMAAIEDHARTKKRRLGKDEDISEVDSSGRIILSDDEPDVIMPQEDLDGVVVEPDEAQLDLQLALSKARRLKRKEITGPEKVVGKAHEEMKEQRSLDDVKSQGIILNSTAEFCRSLGDIPTYGQAGNRDEEAEELMELERELLEERRRQEEERENSAWNEVDMEENKLLVLDDAPILDDEPDVGVGLGGALQLAIKKGYIEKEMKKSKTAPRHSQLEAASYTIEDKSRFEEDRQGRRERYSGPVSEFKEKETYRPDVKLEYIDDNGRLLNQKEAFRFLSHKFHGKGPGKNKVEMRVKKVQEEALMKRMSSTDTPLGTLALLQEKQKQTQSPYILLSGGSKTLTIPTIAKQQ